MIVSLFVIFFFVGIVLLWRGIRGAPEFSEPLCARCKYDLRTLDWSQEERVCPECGSDLKQQKAVRFGEYQKRPKIIIAGGIVMLFPVVFVIVALIPEMMGYRGWSDMQSNEAIIANLTNTAGQPWDWRRLEQRHARGELSKEESVAAIEHLITYLEKRTGGRQPLHWSDDFFKIAVANNLIGPNQMKRLAKAFYGSFKPTVSMRKRLRAGTKKLSFSSHQHISWNLPDMKVAMALTKVKLDGTLDEFRQQYF